MTVIDVGPAKVDLLRIRAGDRNLLKIAVTSNGGAMDLTGMTAEAQARLSPNAPDPPALTAVVTITDEFNGLLELRWPGAEVENVLAGADKWTGVWDLQLINPGEDPLTLVAGAFSIEPDVTR